MVDSDVYVCQVLDVFCGLFGSIIGDMVLFYGVYGGVYLVGGILLQICEYLYVSIFVECYLQKGLMGEVLVCILVKVVEYGQLGVVGVVSWYLQ